MFYISTANDENNYGIKEGTMYIIAADYMKNSLVKIAETDDDGNTTATWTGALRSNSYAIYWSSSAVPSAQYDSYILDDTFSSLGPFMAKWDKMNTANYYKYNQNNNGKCVTTLLNTSNWTNFLDSSYGEYAIGSPTLEMWVASYNSSNNWSKGTKGYTQLYYNASAGSDGEYGYYIGLTEDTTQYYQYVKSASSDSQSGVTKPRL